jgi:AcrR family transcriptional regulator
MPKTAKVTREDILKGAIAIVRESGSEALNARAIATRVGCSTQPIFSNYASMEELRADILEYANDACYEFMQREIKRGEFPPFKAIGMAYIDFAKEEKELFRLLYMRDRTGEIITEGAEFREVLGIIQKATGLDEARAEQFYLSMWITVHGIASMFATSYLDLDRKTVGRFLTDAYEGLKLRYADAAAGELT